MANETLAEALEVLSVVDHEHFEIVKKSGWFTCVLENKNNDLHVFGKARTSAGAILEAVKMANKKPLIVQGT